MLKNTKNAMNNDPSIKSGRDTIQAGRDVTQVDGDYIAGDQINAHDSPGFINKPSGPVNQEFHTHYHGPQNAQEHRFRQRLINHVRDFWIAGVLEKSLYQEVLIALDLYTDPSSTKNQTINYKGMRLTRNGTSDSKPHPLPPGTTIADVFAKAQQRLLILGAPGGGKTTLLLVLTRTLLERAETDEQHPIPVVFNLSSWAQQRQPLDQWLVQELRMQYGVGKDLAKMWVQQRAILPLLDGLDEVATAHRTACVQAINTYCAEHSPDGIVVCSRLAEFRDMATPLALEEAVVLQPLDDEQLATFFAHAGEPLAAVQSALQTDNDLRTLARVPLRLHIIALAYHGSDPAELIGQPPAEQRTRLFAHYIERMFQRHGRTDQQHYTPEQTVHWLSWLAERMVEHGQTMFYLDKMEPSDWLLSYIQRSLYRLIVPIMTWGIGGAILALALGITTELCLGLNYPIKIAILTILPLTIIGLIHGLLDLQTELEQLFKTKILRYIYKHSFLSRTIHEHSTRLKQDKQKTIHIGNSCFGFAFSMSFPIIKKVQVYIGSFPVKKNLYVLIQAFEGIEDNTQKRLKIHLIEKLYLSKISMVVLFIFFSLIQLLPCINSNFTCNIFNLVIQIVFQFVMAFFLSLRSIEIDVRKHTFQGLISSIWNAISIGLIVWLFISVPMILIFWDDHILNTCMGYVIGIVFGLSFGLQYGGRAFIQYAVLYILLCLGGYIPYRYVRFLDYATERIFLRKVGGSYIFVHRMLLEYFAGLEGKEQG